MKREIIIIDNGIVSIPQSGAIRMTAHEIASLFEVYILTINNHAKAILKSGVIQMDVSCPATVIGNTIMPDFYGLDMITALAFRIQSHKAEVFREWLIKKAVKQPPVFIRWEIKQKIGLN